MPGFVTQWPSFSRSVRSAASASSGYDSCQRMCESYVQPLSKPYSSAFSTSSSRRVYGGSGRTVTPNVSMRPPACGSWEGKWPSSRETSPVATWGYLAFGLAAGAMLPIQFGVNAQLARWVDSPLRATLVSFAVGTLVLLVAAIPRLRGWPGP